ncbi:hypothetical protein JG688_00011742 [Phytophthora aleatoria]|uniref:ZSWIM1/3 RNaseH-like domain-containing protein n=1 Tax=Phytophthora aleatoria TaxID=2496075 RepID=A0A8J5ILI8_9STRA|nr:hypothetical protein JG688_00011742 [Phytophthora aleatoria]
MQTYAKWTFTTRVAQNNRIEARYSVKDEQPPDAKLFMDESYYYYLVVFVCIQAGEHQDRGNGKRPRQHVRSIGCGGTLDSRCTSKSRSSGKKLLKYIWENMDCEPDMVDVHNFLAKLKRKEETGTTLSDRVSETLDRFCKEEEFGVAHADINRQGDKVRITWHMRFLFSAFPETLLADATHDTNASRYKLFSFMVQDSLGKGQHVQVRYSISFYLCIASMIVRAQSEEDYQRCFDFMKERWG